MPAMLKFDGAGGVEEIFEALEDIFTLNIVTGNNKFKLTWTFIYRW